MRTVAVRVALVCLGLFGLSALTVSAVIDRVTDSFLNRQAEETIGAELDGLLVHLRQGGMDKLVQVLRDRTRVPRSPDLFVLTNARGVPVAGNLPGLPEGVGADGWLAFRTAEGEAGGRAPAVGVVRTLADGHRLLVGTELGQWQGFRTQIVRALFWSFTVLLAISAFGGWLVSRHVTRRLEVINRITRTIIDGHLHARIPRSPNGDELDRLAANLNDMLEQIEGLMAGLRDLSEDIAHDLRTPLNRLRGQLELALSEAREEGPVRDLVQEAIVEADRLLEMFGALLSIAKAQAGYQQMPLSAVALPPVLRRVVELYEPVAEEKHITLTLRIAVSAVVRGHEQLLAQALANLVDNAVKYTPDGGRIDVVVASGQEPGSTDVTVADSGIGIPSQEHERVLGRFIRLDWSRSTPGNGLGLALVDAVVRLHGARLAMEDNQPGLRVRLSFPDAGSQGFEAAVERSAGG